MYSIPHFNEFSNLLHDRLHAILYHIEEMSDKFTLITNLIDRSPEYILQNQEVLRYAGAEMQRKILEDYMEREDKDKQFDDNWKYLSENIIEGDTPKVETFRFLNDFREGKLDMASIKAGFLRDYFLELSNKFQENEYEILKEVFDIEEDMFLSIPIIAFGTIDGVVHIIGKIIDINRLNNVMRIRRIIKLFTLEYENLLMDWDVAFENVEKIAEIKFKKTEYDKSYVKNNPIMQDLKLLKYYEISENSLEKKTENSNKAPKLILGRQRKILEQHRQNAIISILIDSFAHNISTHSLTALAWWFAERAVYSEARKRNIRELLKKYDKDINQNPLVLHKKHINEPLSKELNVLLRFLAEKAIFWNAITRKTNFTGQFFNLYDVLYKEFIHNPLYLGSIANSENVSKIHFHFTFYSEETSLSAVTNKKIIQEKNNQLLEGRFASINFKDFYKKKNRNKKNQIQLKDSDTHHIEFTDSVFVEKGKKFKLLKGALQETIAFFPSGIVGKHALFTILENEIRNVKHYRKKVLKRVQKKGLIINISIHFRPVDSDANPTTPFENYELLKLGIWLKHPSKNTDSSLIAERFEQLAGDIITPDTFRPKLGGMYQDKICAAMLFNNTFDSVQHENNTERDKRYYPWVKSAVSPVENKGRVIHEFEISQRRYKTEKEENRYKDDYEAFLEKYGGEKKNAYYKKYIHLWKAENIHPIRKNEQLKWENKARFKFLQVDTDDIEGHRQLRKEGFIRILTETVPDDDIVLAYQKWLQKWHKSNDAVVIDLRFEQDRLCRFIYKDGQLIFQNSEEINNENNPHRATYSSIKDKRVFTVAHGSSISIGSNYCNFRSTGVLLRHFFDVPTGITKIEDLETASISPLHRYELFETLLSKIAIIDERVFDRVPPRKRKFYRKKLQLEFYDEDFVEWDKNMEKKDLTKYHFLVVHLSFIERMKKRYNPKQMYGEGDIVEFISDWILKDRGIDEIPDNFVLVIITGRGRIEWWDKLIASGYDRFVTFRPIESLLSAVEDAILLNDDFNLKYYTSKVLFGS